MSFRILIDLFLEKTQAVHLRKHEGKLMRCAIRSFSISFNTYEEGIDFWDLHITKDVSVKTQGARVKMKCFFESTLEKSETVLEYKVI